MGAGRPSLLNDETMKMIVDELSGGSSIPDASAMAGVCTDTVRRWIREGVRVRRDLDDHGTAIPDERTAMAEFSVAVQRARAESRGVARVAVKAKFGESWQAAAWWLERTAPQEYGRTMRTEISGPGEGPIQIEAAGSIGDAIKSALAAVPEIVLRSDDDE